MWNSGKKNCALRDKNKYILTLVLSEKKILNETKNHNPPLQVKWSFPNVTLFLLLKDPLCMKMIPKYVKSSTTFNI